MNNGPLVVVTDSPFPSLDPAKKALEDANAEVVQAPSSSEEDIIKAAENADAILVTYAKLNENILRSLKNCKAIGRFGIGVDNIDLKVAGELGISVNYVPDYCLDEVSDQAMAMIISMARKIPQSNKLVQSGRWEMPAVVPMYRLRGKTVGLIGFGNIPRLMTPKAQAFGFNVIASDPYAPKELFEKYGVESVSMDELYERSDFISVHAPLLPETKGLVNKDAFKKMKDTAIIVNTARGPLINEKDLIEALDKNEIGGAGLDVVETEPLPENSPLIGRDNVILAPHTAFYSVEALEELQTKAASDVARVLNGEEPVYPIKA
ncbi:MAG: hydroxyacid dehydrogenase [Rhodobiaceae bacterium]|nr:hydroxyacid dehydrogenase [Rhodobiaceae bacterium]MEC7088701.1 C-terminal binding protein [Pseudomonadota bacterium]MEC8403541.1 C-terminal binding protein [Pseudomonadota bacterium]MEC8452607.1 C-terminal binding protein [Pseudomonadota bacterium]|tara:strand:- start:6903 stop:7865 length:963 start_codon:yes stop_codon:yes gene_type:complete